MVTVGIGLLDAALREQAVRTAAVDWHPPMPGTAADLARGLWPTRAAVRPTRSP